MATPNEAHSNTRTWLLATGAFVIAAAVLASPFYFKFFTKPTLPALHSVWVHFHVPTGYMAYAAALVALILCAAGMIRRAPVPGIALTFQVVAGLSFVICLFTGSVFAGSAWGSYWPSDYKTTYSLRLLAIILATTFVMGWHYSLARRPRSGRICGISQVAALIMQCIQLAGAILLIRVSYVMQGLHSLK